MKTITVTLLIVFCLFSCDAPKGSSDTGDKLEENYTVENQSIVTKATVLSVSEELIMPDDYLTTAMTVKTSSNDTLVFLDMDGFEKLVNKEITIKYKLVPGTKSLVCFDCKEYSGEIKLYDITSFPSEVTFEILKLKHYFQDEYIVVASIYEMVKKDGSIEDFYALDYELANDSTKMASAFHSYGIITKLSPRLENKEELEKLAK